MMKSVGRLRREYVDFVSSLYCEGFLDDQFGQLQKLQDESDPGFVVELVTLFFEDSEKLLKNLENSLRQQEVDYKQVDANVHQFKGSSTSIGANRVKNLCVAFRNCCEEKSLDRCLRCLQELKNEFHTVKNKLETVFQLERQIVEAGGMVPLIP